MKKKLLVIFSVLLFTLCFAFSACEVNVSTDTTSEKLYTLKLGKYEFKTVTLTNVMTKEVEEKTVDDLFNDKEFHEKWDCLLSFGIGINEDTTFMKTKDNRRLVINDSFVYEVIGDNTLKFHIKRWNAYDGGLYEIIMILGWVPSYC